MSYDGSGLDWGSSGLGTDLSMPTFDTSWMNSEFGSFGNNNNGLNLGNNDSSWINWGSNNGAGSLGNNGMGTVFNLGNSILNTWLGMQQLNLAKDQFAFQKDAWAKQYDQQSSLLNTQMRDRQKSRNDAYGDTGATETPDSYMNSNGV